MESKTRKRAVEVLEFLATIRARYPMDIRIKLVMDNLSAHKTRAVLRYCKANRISPVFTATNASWMNRIECHFAPFKKFVISNSDYGNHGEIEKAAQDYLTWRNAEKRSRKILEAQKSIRVL